MSVKKRVSRIHTRSAALMAAVSLGLSNAVFAALPTPVATPDARSAVVDGDAVSWFKSLFQESSTVMGLAAMVVAFIVCAWIVVAKFNEARTGKCEWTDFGVAAGGSTAVLVVVGYFLNQAAGVI
ncbi:MAG: TIGR03745 family integrating conjugative element membrane protein [Gammaproteobacteria bacterium]|nr:TIGR03745 family integrating conjugative element membrane protein [Gammaproteobacteria bacterium]